MVQNSFFKEVKLIIGILFTNFELLPELEKHLAEKFGEIDYKSSARYGDTVRVNTQVERVGRSSVHFLQTITRDEKLLITSRITWVCVNTRFKPMSIPKEIKQALEN